MSVPAATTSDVGAVRRAVPETARLIRTALTAVAIILVCGVVLGVATGFLFEPLTGQWQQGGVGNYDPADVTNRKFAAVLIFVVGAAIYGVVTAVIALTLRVLRGPEGAVAVSLAALAGSTLALWIGRLISESRWPNWRSVPIGETFHQPTSAIQPGAELGSLGMSWFLVIVAPFVAIFIYLIAMVLWRDPTLGWPDNQPAAPPFTGIHDYRNTPAPTNGDGPPEHLPPPATPPR